MAAAVRVSNVMKGVTQVPVPSESGEIHEVISMWDTAVDGVLVNGDYLQLAKIPAGCVLVNVQGWSSVTMVTTEFAVGIATSSTALTNASSLIAAGVIQTSVVATTRILISAVTPPVNLQAPTAEEGIILSLIHI